MIRSFAACAVLIVATVSLQATAADNRPIDDFFGDFVGKSIAGSTGAAGDEAELTPRHLNVSIRPSENGFSVAWLTVITPASGKTKAKSFLVNFRESGNPGIYAAAMRPDANGTLVPHDPMSGNPYIWASILGDTLTVHAMQVTDDGGYDIQIYERTLTEDGMDLVFRRFMDGALMKEIAGQLSRVRD